MLRGAGENATQKTDDRLALARTVLVGILDPVLSWYQSDEHPERDAFDIVRDIVADLQQDRADCRRLRSALKPFARAANIADLASEDSNRRGMGKYSDDCSPGWRITYAAVKTAREALEA